MVFTRENDLSGFQLEDEHDAAYQGDDLLDKEIIAEIGESKIVLHGSTEPGALEGASYLSVDAEYTGELSIGQRQLFEILRALDLGSIYCVTTVQRLADMLQLKSPLAVAARLDNLQSLGAISGVKLG